MRTALPAAAPAAETAAAASAVLTKATLRSAGLLGLSNSVLARAVGLSEASISRMSSGAKAFEVGSKPAELAALVVRVYRSLDALVGNNEEHRRLWMTSFNRAFNATPRDAIQTAEGLVRVVTYLDAARAPA
ncbi:antitoxin Xre/MbcA/ParS toxin-binding domain-containing protein [Caenimonas terrae]|uniref:Antitoxin Xre/MbcA/ParS toxin-binding domain-containing protein n=1 Tax=Caenimonas terrae TaxID=696074 RepID=A0ABW0NI91_9BURK